MTHDISEGTRLGMDALLQELVLDSADVADFLAGLAALPAAVCPSPSHGVLGLILTRRKKPVIVADSDPQVRTRGDAESGTGKGPCLAVPRGPAAVLVPDLPAGHRWPRVLQRRNRAGRPPVASVRRRGLDAGPWLSFVRPDRVGRAGLACIGVGVMSMVKPAPAQDLLTAGVAGASSHSIGSPPTAGGSGPPRAARWQEPGARSGRGRRR